LGAGVSNTYFQAVIKFLLKERKRHQIDTHLSGPHVAISEKPFLPVITKILPIACLWLFCSLLYGTSIFTVF